MKQLAIVIVIAAGVAGYKIFTAAERGESGEIVDAGTLDAFQMRVGDCFDDVDELLTGSDEISSVPGVPCSEPHDNEVFAVFDVSMSEFPGDEELANLAFESCIERFPAFAGRDYETSVLDVTAMWPSRDSWRLQDDREVVCAVYDLNFEKLVGSVKGLGI